MKNTLFSSADHAYMTKARALARKSMRAGEVPVGAVVVDAHGVIIGRGYNRVEGKQTQLCHAELTALAKATRARNGWRLDGCTLYVTLEPCMMCLGAALLSRISTIIYGAPSPLFGISAVHALLQPSYTTHTTIRQGLQENECSDILKRFFANIRSHQGVSDEHKSVIYRKD